MPLRISSANKSSDVWLANPVFGGIALGLIGAGFGYAYGTWLVRDMHESVDTKNAIKKELTKQN